MLMFEIRNITLSEISQSEKDKYRVFTHERNLINTLTNKKNRDRLIDGEQADNLGQVGVEGGKGMNKTGKRKKELMDTDNTVVIGGQVEEGEV